jgi:hypothetical protein
MRLFPLALPHIQQRNIQQLMRIFLPGLLLGIAAFMPVLLLIIIVTLQGCQQQLQFFLLIFRQYFANGAQLGFGKAVDNGITVSKPTSLAMSMLSAAEIRVSITKGACGVDTPTAALLSAVSEVQLDEVSGTIQAKGIGVDGGAITRVYLLDV